MHKKALNITDNATIYLVKSKDSLFAAFKKQKALQVMALLPIVWMLIFNYYPILGLQIAFKDYNFRDGIWGSAWVGLKHFKDLLVDPYVYNVLVNTLGISTLKALIGFPLPILLALSLNEVRNANFKRTIQTVSYLPYFISWSIVALMATNWLSPSLGFVNEVLLKIGILKEPYLFLGEPNAFWWISLVLDSWKTTGFAAVIYLSAITGIDQEMYESATIDGANRFQKIIYITIPSIMGTIMTMFILNMGSLLNGGLYAQNFQISFLLGNGVNVTKSDILDTYVLRIGLQYARYSFATAFGFLSSLVAMMLLFTTNFFSKKITKESFF